MLSKPRIALRQVKPFKFLGELSQSLIRDILAISIYLDFEQNKENKVY